MSVELPPIISDENCGYIVPVAYGKSRVEAAQSLVEEMQGGPHSDERWSRRGLLALARTAHPRTNGYLKGEFEDGYWYTTDPHENTIEWTFAFDGWFFDCAFVHLEECVELDGESDV